MRNIFSKRARGPLAGGRILALGSGLTALLTTVFLSGCTPDNNTAGLGPAPKASFTVAPVSGKTNTFVCTAGTDGVFGWYWSTGNGSPAAGTASDTIHFAQHGNYRIVLTAVGRGGYDTASQVVSVAGDDLGNTVIAGGTLDANSASSWTTLNTGGPQTTFTFTSSGLVLSNTGNSNGAVYQAIQVQSGVNYTFSANVSGSGITDSWVEFYIGSTVPTQGSDYSDNKIYSLNWWSGCGLTPFNGNVVKIGCNGNGPSSGVITFPTSGTYYVMIKAGSSGGTLGSGGVTVADIALDH
ncbi:MAG TPA: hypothetical protein VG605_06320 [Puia sp.]|nr:hypothetical protein [Puia sp.]